MDDGGILFSVIVPVRDRPKEVQELLRSFSEARVCSSGWELILVEDGSTASARDHVQTFEPQLPLKYLSSPPLGRSAARNEGAQCARGKYLLFLDSDCKIPQNFLVKLGSFLEIEKPNFWGGPDRALTSDTPIQRAIGFVMSSYLTTAGLRGGRQVLTEYFPRGMNLGVRSDLFHQVGGFVNLNGEDIEFGWRLKKVGYTARYVDDLFVFHSNRSSFLAFLKKTFEAGASKAQIWKSHRKSIQWVQLLPTLALVGGGFLLRFKVGQALGLGDFLVVAVACFIATKSFLVAFYAAIAAFILLVGYGVGFVAGFFMQGRAEEARSSL